MINRLYSNMIIHIYIYTPYIHNSSGSKQSNLFIDYLLEIIPCSSFHHIYSSSPFFVTISHGKTTYKENHLQLRLPHGISVWVNIKNYVRKIPSGKLT